MMENVSTVPAETVFDPQAFKDHHRVHVQDGSLFTGDHFIVVHPAELDPANEPQLAAKLLKHYSLESPPFFAFQPRGAIALQLATLMPLSMEAKKSTIMKAMADVMEEEYTGRDPNHAEEADKRRAPFEALIRHYLEEPEKEAAPIEFMNNAIGTYLLINEALHLRGYQQEAAGYVRDARNPEAILSQLSVKLGVKPQAMLDAMSEGGVDALAELLSVPRQNLEEIRQITHIAEVSRYSNNVIENWNVGRSLPGMQHQGLQEKMAAGMMVRAAKKIMALREQVHGTYQVPQDISDKEDKVVAAMRLLPPELSESLFLLGTEFAYTPEANLKHISAFGGRALGYNHFVPFSHGDTHGMRQIFLSGRQGAREFNEVVVHEITHLLFPQQFSIEERRQIDGLVKEDELRLTALKALVEAWKVGTPSQREAIEAKIEKEFGVGGKGLKASLGPLDMDTFHDIVIDAYNNLNPHSEYFYRIDSYGGPESRAAEVISRYAERRFISLREFPDLLQFVVPGITQLFDQHYMPHIHRQLEELRIQHARGEIPVMKIPDVDVFPDTALIEQARQSDLPQKPTTQISAFSAHLDADLSHQISSKVLRHIDRLNHECDPDFNGRIEDAPPASPALH